MADTTAETGREGEVLAACSACSRGHFSVVHSTAWHNWFSYVSWLAGLRLVADEITAHL